MKWVVIAAVAAVLCGASAPRQSDHAVVDYTPPLPPPMPVEIPLDFFDAVAVAPAPAAPTRTWWRLRAVTTGYSPHDAVDGAYHATKGERWRWITADAVTDVRDVPYGVAVDPRALPYGTTVIVPGYHRGVAVAADDTGGRLRQSWSAGVLHLDLRYKTERSALAWGRKQVVVHVDVTDVDSRHLKQLERFRAP
jgi:3D (Asp-Asp-Asp) domain-containing protein